MGLPFRIECPRSDSIQSCPIHFDLKNGGKFIKFFRTLFILFLNKTVYLWNLPSILMEPQWQKSSRVLHRSEIKLNISMGADEWSEKWNHSCPLTHHNNTDQNPHDLWGIRTFENAFNVSMTEVSKKPKQRGYPRASMSNRKISGKIKGIEIKIEC